MDEKDIIAQLRKVVEMCGLLLKVDPEAKRPIPGYYNK